DTRLQGPQRADIQWFRQGVMPLRYVQPRTIAEDGCRERLLGKIPVGQRRGLLIDRFGLRVLTFGEVDGSKIIERTRKLVLLVAGILFVGRFFIDRQQAPIKRLGLRLAPLAAL